MPDCKKILVFHTAFLGDVILNLPMVQILKRRYPDAEIDVAAIPNAAQVLQNHPAIHSVIEYDKRGSDRGVKGIFKITSLLRRRKYDLAIVSHRSLRSAMIVAGAGIPRRICFSKSAGRWLFTDVVPYNRDLHEIERNISLLSPLGIRAEKRELPSVYPSSGDCATVDRILQEHQIDGTKNSVAVAPGSVWATKRWPADSYADLVRRLLDHGLQALLIGSAGDRELCAYIQQRSEAGSVQNFAGELTVLQSAELIRRCSVLVSNDSAPAHIAVAVRTPVVAIFGPTVTSFGFGPYGEHDLVIQKAGLACRPCSIHGGDECPIGTFECMKTVSPVEVFNNVIVLQEMTSPRLGA